MAKQGFTIFLTGLPGAGKSSIAQRLAHVIQRDHGRSSTVLDGDVVREMISSGLTFSRPDRELNVRRIGYVAGEVTRHGGICICAAVAPYRSSRREVRERVSAIGGFFEVFVATPLDVCERRDSKGLYARARKGEIKALTGIDDPFEIPEHPEVTVDSSRMSLDEEVDLILLRPQRAGIL